MFEGGWLGVSSAYETTGSKLPETATRVTLQNLWVLSKNALISVGIGVWGTSDLIEGLKGSGNGVQPTGQEKNIAKYSGLHFHSFTRKAGVGPFENSVKLRVIWGPDARSQFGRLNALVRG